jgi:hypothetical protein
MRHQGSPSSQDSFEISTEKLAQLQKAEVRTDWRPTTLKSKSLRAFHMFVIDDSTTPCN